MAAKKAPKSVKGQGRVTAPAPSTPKPARKTASKKKAKAPATDSKSVHYIRNLHGGAGGARFDLSVVDTRIHLEPRGRRGDMRLVTEEMTVDPVYQMNLGVLFEEVPILEGQEIIRKQTINQQNGPSTFDLLTNEYGEKYVQTRASVTAPFEQQGQVVARMVPGADGRNTTGNVDFERSAKPTDFFGGRQLGPQAVEVPGSTPVFNPDVMPQGLSVEQGQVFIETPREQRQQLVEQWRIAALEAEGYRNELNVNVEPTAFEGE